MHQGDGDAHRPATAASMAAMSIFCIVCMAAKARWAVSLPAAMAWVSTRGMICQRSPQRSMHQPHSDACPPLPTMACQLRSNVQAQGRCAAILRSVPWSAVLGCGCIGHPSIWKRNTPCFPGMIERASEAANGMPSSLLVNNTNPLPEDADTIANARYPGLLPHCQR